MAAPRTDNKDTHDSSLPTPVAAMLGLVATGVRNARKLPDEAVRLPMVGLGHALQTAETVRRGYVTFAARGVRIVRGLGAAVGLGRQEVAESVTAVRETGREKAGGAEESVEAEARHVAEKARAATKKATQIRRETPQPDEAAAKPQPAAEEVPEEAQEVGAPGAATDVAEQATEETAPAVDGAELSAEDLPLPDIDHMSVASLRARLRTLDIAQLATLRAYEQAHADRLQIVTMLENRIAKLEAEATPAPEAAVEQAMQQAEAGAQDIGATPRP